MTNQVHGKKYRAAEKNRDVESAMAMVAGAARSMGVEVVD